jgi:glycosyltransferase involved in cell wall biosynthesis
MLVIVGRSVPEPSQPRVSAIIGTWNRARYLPDAIGSLLVQTVRDLELIVADDGSTDDTAAVVAAVGDERVRYLPGPHVGISGNLNRALAAARADNVALLDSDDLALPERLERQLEVLESRPEVGVVGCRMSEVDETERELEPRVTFAVGDVNDRLLSFNPISNSCAAFRRQAALDVGGFDTSYPASVDWDLWLRLADRWVVHTLDEELGVRRMHSQNVSVLRERIQIRAGLRTRVATLRRRRTLRGVHGLAPAALSYVTPIPLKQARRKRLGQAH